MLAVMERQDAKVRLGTMDYSVQLVGDGDGLICVQLETHENRWPIRASKHPAFVESVRELLTNGRRKVQPWSVDANLDCEVKYRVHEEPWDASTDRGLQTGISKTVEIDSLTVIYREGRREPGSNLTLWTEYGRVHAGADLLREYANTLREEIEQRLDQ